jgi:Flp pilus assembly pilin Flp
MWFHRIVTRLLLDERGANLVEYAFIVALIVIVAISAVTVVGSATASNIESVQVGFTP